MNDGKAVLKNIDDSVNSLSKIQIDLFLTGMLPDDYNNISNMIGDLKEYMINCKSYTSTIQADSTTEAGK